MKSERLRMCSGTVCGNTTKEIRHCAQVNSEKYKFREFEGITLISLVITIIILIILAGIAINLSIGENGLFNKAKYAKEYYEVKANEEKILLSDVSNEINKYIDYDSKVIHEMKIDKLTTAGTGNGSIKQGRAELIIDVRNYTKLIFGTLNMGSPNYNRLYIYNGRYKEGETETIERMFSEESGKSGIFENMEWDVSKYDYITICLESGRGDEIYIESVTLK